MIERKTQDSVYWGDNFTVTAEDLQYLSTLLVDDELPRSAEELGRALIMHRTRQEEALIDRALSKGTQYQPKRRYEVEEEVVFPVLDYRVGEVVRVRPGRNPQYDSFRVIEVEFEGGERREFASELTDNHPLNSEAKTGTAQGTELRSGEELASLYGPQVMEVLEKRLESESDFVRLADKWFRRDLLVEINEGHLNLAEAVLDVAGGGPLPTDALLGDVELPHEITPQLRAFSLNYVLQRDERFDEVGPRGKVVWFLRPLEPESVQSVPRHLRYEPLEYERALLTNEMQALKRALDDEWSDLDVPGEVSESVTVVLTYPHWKSGTLPLSSRLATVFPTGRTQRIRFTFADGGTGTEMPGWVVREGRYAYGLEEWYRANGIPVGAYLDLAQGQESGTIVIRQRSRHSRSEWVRVALPVEGRLTFEMRKEIIACKYDELMMVVAGDPLAMDKVWTRTQEQGLSVSQLIDEIFPELAKLSPQGTVHAATLYSAVNVGMRTPPGPLLAELAASDKCAPVGDNYWVLDSDQNEV